MLKPLKTPRKKNQVIRLFTHNILRVSFGLLRVNYGWRVCCVFFFLFIFLCFFFYFCGLLRSDIFSPSPPLQIQVF